MRTIGFSTACFSSDFSMEKSIDFALENKFEIVEIDVDEKNFKLNNPDIALLDKIIKLKSDKILDFSLHSPGNVNLGSLDSKKREEDIIALYDTVNFAGKIGIVKIVVHPGHCEPADIAGDFSEIVDYNIKVIKELALYAKKQNVLLCVENLCHEKGTINKNITHFYDMCKNIGLDLVSLTLDTNHAGLIDGLSGTIDIIGKNVRHIHFSSNKGVVSDHCIPQEGVMDFFASGEFFKNFSESIVIELNPVADVKICMKNILLTRDYIFSLIK